MVSTVYFTALYSFPVDIINEWQKTMPFICYMFARDYGPNMVKTYRFPDEWGNIHFRTSYELIAEQQKTRSELIHSRPSWRNHGQNGIYNWLVVDLPLWKIWVCLLGLWHSQYMENNIHVPNHQPDNVSINLVRTFEYTNRYFRLPPGRVSLAHPAI